MKLRDEITKNYNNLDNRVIEFLDKVISDINLNKSNASDYTKNILNMLVIQLVLYYKAIDEISEDSSVTHEADYNRKTKSPAIGVLQKANDQILVLMDKIALSPLSKAKIKNLSKEDPNDIAKEELDILLS